MFFKCCDHACIYRLYGLGEHFCYPCLNQLICCSSNPVGPDDIHFKHHLRKMVHTCPWMHTKLMHVKRKKNDNCLFNAFFFFLFFFCVKCWIILLSLPLVRLYSIIHLLIATLGFITLVTITTLSVLVQSWCREYLWRIIDIISFFFCWIFINFLLMECFTCFIPTCLLRCKILFAYGKE